MKNSIKTFFKKVIGFVSRSPIIYIFSKKVVDYHDNINNSDFETNGEATFLRRNIGLFNTIFDVGANVGEWSLIVNKLSPSARIFAFEPVADTFAKLKSQPFTENVMPQNCGLGAQAGTAEFHLYDNESFLNSSHGRSINNAVASRTETVVIDSLDHFCSQQGIGQIDFLKIDTEGHELAVLQGAQQLLSQKMIKVLQFEYGGTYIDAGILLKDVFELLSEKQYVIYKLFSDRIEKISAYQQPLENFQYANFVAAAPGVNIK